MLPQLPEDHKPKSDLRSTLPLCAPASVASLVQSLYWTVALLLMVDMLLVVEVGVELCVLNATKKVPLLDVQVG